MSTSDDTTIRIQLTKGYSCIIDEIDSDLSAGHWHYNIGYAGRSPKTLAGPRERYLHRIIACRKIHRALLVNEEVDHINGNTLDNRRENLRVCSHSKNIQNQKKSTRNQYGLKGVTKRPDCPNRPYKSAITVNGITHHLGYFSTPEEAHNAYCEAAILYHGEFARFD